MCVRICSPAPQSLQSPHLEPMTEGGFHSPLPAAVQSQRNHRPDETLTSQAHFYTSDMKTQTVRIPLSHLECEQTHVAKTDLHNI